MERETKETMPIRSAIDAVRHVNGAMKTHGLPGNGRGLTLLLDGEGRPMRLTGHSAAEAEEAAEYGLACGAQAAILVTLREDPEESTVPTGPERDATTAAKRAFDKAGITLMDHIVLGRPDAKGNTCFSFAEETEWHMNKDGQRWTRKKSRW